MRKVLEMGLGILYIPQGWVRICDGLGGNHITYQYEKQKIMSTNITKLLNFASVLTTLQNFGSLTQTSSQII